MLRLEAELIRKWREANGLTQDQLAERCPRPLTRGAISDLETRQPDAARTAQRASMSIDNLINVIGGLGIQGDTDAQRLAMFFLGPDVGRETKHYFSHNNSHQENYRLGRIRAEIAAAIHNMVEAGIGRDRIAAELGLSLTELALVEELHLALTVPQFQRLCQIGKVSADELLNTGVSLPTVVQQRLSGLLEAIEAMTQHLDSLEQDVRRLTKDTR